MQTVLLSRAVIRRCLSSLLIGVLGATLCGCRVIPGPKPIFRRDLRPFGYPTDTLGGIVGSFTDISFLSDDLVLVTVNTTTFGDEGSSDFDQPESRLLLFDLSRRGAPTTVAMPVRKAKDSVQSAGNGSFVLLNRAGLQICSPALQCGPAVETGGPMFLSPQGTRIAAGRIEQKVLDGSTLRVLHEFGANEPKVIPGDTGLLYTQQGKLYVTLADHPGPQFVLDTASTGVWPEARFLDAKTISAVQSDKSIAIARLDGTILSRVPLSPGSFVAEISTSAAGSRFCFHDAGYSGWNAFLSFFSIERPFNLERARVVDVATGKAAFRLRWDPRPYVGLLARPALSPDGHRLAVIRRGFLEVFAIP
ncbi:MAG TPA: hypothetical protein VMD98_04235 [Bryocella sp.]|nr:hypothetical protein [Bryocella sp.]